jgi:hypothetical protein
MIKITKARRNGIISSLLILPLFLGFAGWAGFSGNWWAALGILGVWGFFFLFATSWLFQALVIFLAAIYAFSQKYWLAAVGGLLLTAYLYYASRLTDKDMNTLPERINTISPALGNLFDVVNNPRKHPILLLVILAVSAVLTGIVIWLLK